jgi:phosphotransferase system  glucose/maltose/N-acetylglucosamine-specific IIC component
MNKKSQVKFGETFAIIILVYIILMGGLLFYNNYNENSLFEIKNKYQNELAFEKYNFIKNLNLIHVTNKGVIEDEFSLLNLLIFYNFSKTDEGKKFLEPSLENAIFSMKIYQFNETTLKYNFDKETLNFTFYNKTPKNKEKYNIKNFKTISIVYNEFNKTKEIAILNLEIFYK